jgi:hypothetical protein
MPHKIKLAPLPYTGLRPSSPGDRRSLASIVFYMVGSIAVVAALFALQRHWQQVRELTWTSATGKILDVQPDTLMSHGATYHPENLYTVKVLISVPINGTEQQRWISLRRSPVPIAEIQLEAQRWKGAICIVRWNPTDNSQIDAEVS